MAMSTIAKKPTWGRIGAPGAKKSWCGEKERKDRAPDATSKYAIAEEAFKQGKKLDFDVPRRNRRPHAMAAKTQLHRLVAIEDVPHSAPRGTPAPNLDDRSTTAMPYDLIRSQKKRKLDICAEMEKGQNRAVPDANQKEKGRLRNSPSS